MAASQLPATLHTAKPIEALQHRICWTNYAVNEPQFRAAISGRFDDPLGVFGTLYCAPSFDVCYAETLVRERFNPSTCRYEVPELEHNQRSLCLLLVDFSKLKIVDLYGPGLQAMGLNNKVLMADYPETRDLARTIYEHPDAPDGIVYLSRFAPSQQPAVVLFDRARPHVRCVPGLVPIPLQAIPEAFTAITQAQSIALI